MIFLFWKTEHEEKKLDKSSLHEMFCKKCVLKNFANFARKHVEFAVSVEIKKFMNQ